MSEHQQLFLAAVAAGAPSLLVLVGILVNHARLTDLGHRMGGVGGNLRREMSYRFDAVDQRFNAVDQRFNAVDERFNAVDEKLLMMSKVFDTSLTRLTDRLIETARRVEVLEQISR